MKTQRAENGYWLYQDRAHDDRYFTKEIYLPDDGIEWPECTDEEKVAWEEAHAPEDEVQEAEIAE